MNKGLTIKIIKATHSAYLPIITAIGIDIGSFQVSLKIIHLSNFCYASLIEEENNYTASPPANHHAWGVFSNAFLNVNLKLKSNFYLRHHRE